MANSFGVRIIAQIRMLCTKAANTEYYAEHLDPTNCHARFGAIYVSQGSKQPPTPILDDCCRGLYLKHVRTGLEHYTESVDEISPICMEEDKGEVPCKSIDNGVDKSLDAYWHLLHDVRNKFRDSKIRNRWAKHYFYTHDESGTTYKWIEIAPVVASCKKNVNVGATS